MEKMQSLKVYKYLISRGHHLVKIEDKIFLIDTGSPISFSLSEEYNSIRINDNKFDMRESIVEIDREVLNEFVGVNIDGILGVDILNKIGGVHFDKINKTITFTSGCNSRYSVRVPIKLFGVMGLNYIDIKFDFAGNTISALLDTGAYMSYIDPDIARIGIPDGNAVDYSPSFGGWIETTKVVLPVTIGSQSQDISVAIMTKTIKNQLNMLGYKAVLGINEIEWNNLTIDIKNQELKFE